MYMCISYIQYTHNIAVNVAAVLFLKSCTSGKRSDA